MKNNIKKKLRYSINICLLILLIFMSVPTGLAAVSSVRTIETNTLVAGNGTNVTVVIQNDITQALSLQEIIPSGWVVTKISDDADQFKASTNEWVWLTATSNTVKTVIYKVTVPLGTAPGVYNIKGNTTASGSTKSVTGGNTITVVNNTVVPPVTPPVPPVQGFGFVASPSSLTVDAGENATYNLTISNNGNATDTYNLVINKPNNVTANLDKSSVTVGQGNSSTAVLTVSSSTAGTYVVSVNATSKADANNSKSITTTTNVIVPVLAIENFKSVPSTAISKTNPAKISANIIKGIYNIVLVEFGAVDSNNLLKKGQDMILGFDSNSSGNQGLYSHGPLPGVYATIVGNIASGNIAVTDIVTVETDSNSPGDALVTGTFKANSASAGTDAMLHFNQTTGNLSSVTDLTGKVLSVQSSNSTFRANISKFVNGNIVQEYTSTNAYILYSMTGNASANNPYLVSNTLPNGRYRVYASAKDTNGSVIQWIDIDTIPPSTGGRSSGGGGSSDGTYPTFTATPVPTVNATVVATVTATAQPTIVETVSKPAETVGETPIDMGKKDTPGFGIVAIIGVIGAIYILRRMK